jgi:septal ring factor EnvC (AmiA/AmiB activator)
MASVNAAFQKVYGVVVNDIKAALEKDSLMTPEIEQAFANLGLKDKKRRKKAISGYNIFMKETSKEIVDVEGREKMTKVSSMWKTLSDEEKEVYNERAKTLNEEASGSDGSTSDSGSDKSSKKEAAAAAKEAKKAAKEAEKAAKAAEKEAEKAAKAAEKEAEKAKKAAEKKAPAKKKPPPPVESDEEEDIDIENNISDDEAF